LQATIRKWHPKRFGTNTPACQGSCNTSSAATTNLLHDNPEPQVAHQGHFYTKIPQLCQNVKNHQRYQLTHIMPLDNRMYQGHKAYVLEFCYHTSFQEVDIQQDGLYGNALPCLPSFFKFNIYLQALIGTIRVVYGRTFHCDNEF